ncbi:MAG TPA: glycosyltransferase family 39 protein, partial [Thermoanaerobaculia bacterium]|nr:glycosyltransferase family 39 protein [Thermoanaerobaculia bacterium]
AAAVPWVLGAWGLLVGVAMALRPILPVDETRYLSVAWEMWQRGDLLVPHLNGLPYSDKPPLLFWLFHLGWWLFGVNEWWPRLVPALFSLASLFLARSLARRLWPDQAAVARRTPAVLLGLTLWSVYTTLIMFDMLVACAVLVALHGLLTARERGIRGWLVVGAALGIGGLAKGPVVLVMPLTVALLAPWWAGTKVGVRWWAGLLGAVAMGASIALAWAVPAAAAGGGAYARAILFTQTEERLVYSLAHGRPWWWYLALLPVMLFPYSFWVPAWKGVLRLTADAGTRFCLAWLMPGLVVFSLISGKQPHYLLPLLPAVALLIARGMETGGEAGLAARRWHLAPPLAFLVLVGAAIATARWAERPFRLPTWAGLISPGAGLALLALAAVFVLSYERLFATRRTAVTLVGLALVVALHVGFAEIARKAYDLEPIARYASVMEWQGRPIAFIAPYHGQLHFLGRLARPFEVIQPGAELVWVHQHPRGKVIQDLDYAPPGLVRADFTQSYREDVLAVWGRESLPQTTP